MTEAENLQEKVDDPLDYLGYDIESGQMILDDYYADVPVYKKSVYQSSVVRVEQDLIATMETFDPNSETDGHGPDQIYKDEAIEVTPAQNAIGLALLIGVPLIVILALIFLIRWVLKRKKASR